MSPFKRWLLFVLVLTAIACVVPFEAALEKAYEPRLGGQPGLFVTVKGERHPDLEVEFSAKYVTTNPRCQETINWLEGVRNDRAFSVLGTVEQSRTSFLARIPVTLLNERDSGYCGWRFYKTYVTVRHKDPGVDSQTQELVSINNATGRAPPLPPMNFICEKLKPRHQDGRSSIFCKALDRRYFSVNENATTLDVGFLMRQ